MKKGHGLIVFLANLIHKCADGLLEHYGLRSSKLNEMCLAEYATWYDYFTYKDGD